MLEFKLESGKNTDAPTENGAVDLDQCLVPGPNIDDVCSLVEFHVGRHSWSPGPEPEPEPEPHIEPYSFEILADVKAVRGKNTSDGPALEIVLDASIGSHASELMGLIGKSLTRVVFRPFAYQPRLPDLDDYVNRVEQAIDAAPEEATANA